MKEQEVIFGSQLSGIINGDGDRGPVVIAHGAGAGMTAALLKKTAVKLAELGFIVLRFNFGYVSRKSAPSLGGKKEEPDLSAAIDYMKEHGNPILVGRSFGARVCANVSLERDDVKAMVFYGMPLQGASKTAKPRDWSHLPKIKVPMLFITGDKDQLCPLDQLEEIVEGLTAAVTSIVVPGDHGFKPKSEDLAVEKCCSWIDSLKG